MYSGLVVVAVGDLAAVVVETRKVMLNGINRGQTISDPINQMITYRKTNCFYLIMNSKCDLWKLIPISG
jgi:hypothetical protein